MKLAIMQPYIFPYIGYFQLVNAVDKFIFYDDVDYIKQGWINRNKILLNGEPRLFTIPLANASSFRKIKDTLLNEKEYKSWLIKFYKTMNAAYCKAPYYKNVFSLLQEVFEKGVTTIGELAMSSVSATLSYLDVHTALNSSSAGYFNLHLSGKERVIDICVKEKASCYVNAQDG